MEMSLEIDYNSLGNPGSDFKATGTVIEIFFILQSFFVFLNRPPPPPLLFSGMDNSYTLKPHHKHSSRK